MAGVTRSSLGRSTIPEVTGCAEGAGLWTEPPGRSEGAVIWPESLAHGGRRAMDDVTRASVARSDAPSRADLVSDSNRNSPHTCRQLAIPTCVYYLHVATSTCGTELHKY